MQNENITFRQALPSLLIVGGIATTVIGGGIALTHYEAVGQDEVAVMIGGGPLDSKKRQVKGELLQRGRYMRGMFDGMQRFPSNDTIRYSDFTQEVTTKDGKKVKLTGQIGFRFIGESTSSKDFKPGQEALKFASTIGARKFDGDRPGESDKGWKGFLATLVEPEIFAQLKNGFMNVYCADFEASCRVIDPRKNVPATDAQKAYKLVAKNVDAGIREKLGGSYIQVASLSVKDSDLPDDVQKNVDAVASEQARTKAARQSQATAAAESKALLIRGRALQSNRGLTAIEVAKLCKGGENCTIVLDGSGSVSIPTR